MTRQFKLIYSLLLTILIVLIVKPAVVYGEGEPVFDSDFEPGNYLTNIVYIFFVLIVIIGMIIILIRFLAAKNKKWMSNRAMKNLSGIQLGQNKSIQLIEIGNSLYVIGVGENIQLIEKIDQLEEIDAIKNAIHTHEKLLGAGSLAFTGKLFERFRKSKSDHDVEAENELSFQEVFINKMKRIKQQKNEVENILRVEDQNERDERL